MSKSTTKHLLKVIFSTFLCLCLVVVFSVNCFALSASDLFSKSKFKFQNTYGFNPDTAPYPDGAFVEATASNGRVYLWNFKPSSEFFIGSVDNNGTVIHSEDVYTWFLSGDIVMIYSGYPIYMANSLSTSTWNNINNRDNCSYSDTTYYYDNGVMTSKVSEVSHCDYTTTINSANYSGWVCSVPPCHPEGQGYDPAKLQFQCPANCLNYTLAPMLDSSFLTAQSDVSTATNLNNIYSSIASLLTEVQSIKPNVASIASLTNTISSNLATIKTLCNTNLPFIKTCSQTLSQIKIVCDDLLTECEYIDEDMVQGFTDVLDKMDELMNAGDDFDSESFFGSDESGLSDVTSDFNFGGTGIDSIVSTLGNSFNVIKINFEYICNLLGLNEVIVLLLGFSVICYILGKVVSNRMGDS